MTDKGLTTAVFEGLKPLPVADVSILQDGDSMVVEACFKRDGLIHRKSVEIEDLEESTQRSLLKHFSSWFLRQ